MSLAILRIVAWELADWIRPPTWLLMPHPTDPFITLERQNPSHGVPHKINWSPDFEALKRSVGAVFLTEQFLIPEPQTQLFGHFHVAQKGRSTDGHLKLFNKLCSGSSCLSGLVVPLCMRTFISCARFIMRKRIPINCIRKEEEPDLPFHSFRATKIHR